MHRIALQMLVVGCMSFLMDVVACIHIQTLVRGSVVLAVGSIVFLHLAQFPSCHWFNEQGTYGRLAITLAGALGAGLGTLTVILCSL